MKIKVRQDLIRFYDFCLLTEQAIDRSTDNGNPLRRKFYGPVANYGNHLL